MRATSTPVSCIQEDAVVASRLCNRGSGGWGRCSKKEHVGMCHWLTCSFLTPWRGLLKLWSHRKKLPEIWLWPWKKKGGVWYFFFPFGYLGIRFGGEGLVFYVCLLFFFFILFFFLSWIILDFGDKEKKIYYKYSGFTMSHQFLLYSKVTQSYILLILSSIMFYHKWLNTVPCAIYSRTSLLIHSKFGQFD